MYESIPTAIKAFADEIMHPVALIGCRTSPISLDCCEYDLAIFEPSQENKQDNQVVQVDKQPVELMHLTGSIKDHVIDLANMVILKDNSKLMLSSAAKDIISGKYTKMLASSGKKSLISSLFCQQKMRGAKHPVVAAMWLKIAAYEFIDGMIALSGNRPMPVHILEQVRQIDSRRAEGVEVALECIGAERATRPAVSRSMEAIKELKLKDYDKDLFLSKISHLLERRKLVDCYYYAGRVASKNLVSRTESFHRQYTKLVQLALDLSNDSQSLEKMQKRLSRDVKIGLGR
ncbi:MAG: hypothetical protein M3249_03640 [Thermoproteota archaeon]|nr:hypothetical protein [Thermoproteota archaeon]